MNKVGPNCIYITTDVSEQSEMDNLVCDAVAIFGQVDVFWNNAGMMPLSFFDEAHVKEWKRMIYFNIK